MLADKDQKIPLWEGQRAGQQPSGCARAMMLGHSIQQQEMCLNVAARYPQLNYNLSPLFRQQGLLPVLSH